MTPDRDGSRRVRLELAAQPDRLAGIEHSSGSQSVICVAGRAGQEVSAHIEHQIGRARRGSIGDAQGAGLRYRDRDTSISDLALVEAHGVGRGLRDRRRPQIDRRRRA